MSVNAGSTVRFKVSSNAPSYTMDIYRMGYYQGNGARKIASVTPSGSAANQPACLTDAATGLHDCGNWRVTASWNVPSSAVSGIYFARLKRADTGGDNHIIFIVRNDSSRAALLFQTSDTTWQAYNSYGGSSFYKGPPAGRAYKLSYNRPFNTRGTVPDGRDFVWANEYPMVRWLERNGYDIAYQSGADTSRSGNLLKNHKVFLSVGHDEYWSKQQRTNVEAARDAGVHLAFFSGNEVFWKTRWEPSIDGSNSAYRTLVTYKETRANKKLDPTAEWTGTWRDPRFSPPADGDRPENELTGTLWAVNCCNKALVVPADDGKMRFWRNTPVANQAAGGKMTLAANTVGYEFDIEPDNGARPDGLVPLSTTSGPVAQLLTDYGTNVSPGDATHKATLYRAPSGALVFGAGTVQWSWGLDEHHDGTGNPPQNQAMQQATMNLLADMGVQPSTRQSGLAAASASTDRSGPSVSFNAPAPGASVTGLTTVSISGTATDTGGGRVGAVEVSTDDGATWHPATGRSPWTYSWTVTGSGSRTLRARAVDDSGNIGAAATRAVNATCPCSIFGSTAPFTSATTDTGAVTVGVKFRADVAGSVTGVRFYKGPGNTGTHVGSLWSASGTRLAEATFTNETAGGWQHVSFANPVPVQANTTYVAAYYAPSGKYAAERNFYNGTGVDAPPLHALEDGASGPNGVFATGNAFPNRAANATDYGVDVVFSSAGGQQPPTTTPPTTTPPTTTPPTTTPSGTTTRPSTPPSDSCPCSLFASNAVPATPAESDTASVEVGMRFTANVAGRVTGIRFYKGAGNTGTHTGTLWSATGTQLATVTFGGETASGWQQAALSSPVSITAGTTYVVSYHAPNGHYSVNSNYFTHAIDRGPLHAPASSTSALNGMYTYSANRTFPTASYRASNYWVDVVFAPS